MRVSGWWVGKGDRGMDAFGRGGGGFGAVWVVVSQPSLVSSA